MNDCGDDSDEVDCLKSSLTTNSSEMLRKVAGHRNINNLTSAPSASHPQIQSR